MHLRVVSNPKVNPEVASVVDMFGILHMSPVPQYRGSCDLQGQTTDAQSHLARHPCHGTRAHIRGVLVQRATRVKSPVGATLQTLAIGSLVRADVGSWDLSDDEHDYDSRLLSDRCRMSSALSSFHTACIVIVAIRGLCCEW